MGQYVLDHPVQSVAIGLAAQTAAAAAFNLKNTWNKRSIDEEFQINTNTTSNQKFPAVAGLNTGNFIVIWDSYGQDGNLDGVFGQLFNNTADPVGSEFQVNTYTMDDQNFSDVASLTTNNFVVVWQSNGQDGSGLGVYGQLFTSTAGVVGSEFQVNTYTTNDQALPAVAALNNSNFVVVWASFGQVNNYDIFGQLFNSTAGQVGTEFQINTYTPDEQNVPDVASLNNGNFLVAWQSFNQAGASTGEDIYGQLFNSTAGKIGSEFQINTYTDTHQTDAVITCLTNGNIVVVWVSDGQDYSGYGVYGQLFNSSAGAIGSEFRVNTFTLNYQVNPVITFLNGNNFVVVWSSDGEDGSAYGIFGQLFNSTAGLINSEFQVNSYTSGQQGASAIAYLSSGNFVVTWQSDAQDGSSYGVYGKIKLGISPSFSPSCTPSVTPSISASISPSTSISPSITSSPTPSSSSTASPSTTPSVSVTSSPSKTPSPTSTFSILPTPSKTPASSVNISPSISLLPLLALFLLISIVNINLITI